jgi:Reprolysin (M12B) family zinc metalloprotease
VIIFHYSVQIYRQLDIHVVLVGVEVWNKGNKINVTGDATETMTNFLDYRRKVINKQHPNDNAQLIM